MVGLIIRVLLSIVYVRAGVCDARHEAVAIVRARVISSDCSPRAEQVIPVASARHAIIDEELHDDVDSLVVPVGNVLSGIRAPCSIPAHSHVRTRAVGACVASLALGTGIIDMVITRSGHTRSPFEFTHGLRISKKLDCLLDSGWTFEGAQSITPRQPKNIAIEVLKPVLQVLNELCWVGS